MRFNMVNASPLIWVYIVKCADDSYYTGTYQGADLEIRIAEHNDGKYPDAYTASRRPVTQVWASEFTRYDDAVSFERQLKGWSRKKKEAVICGEWSELPALARNHQDHKFAKQKPSSS